jgi:D-alanyl-D-alanine carboxypeptidase
MRLPPWVSSAAVTILFLGSFANGQTPERLSEPDLISALRKELATDAAIDRFAGAALMGRIHGGSGAVLFSDAYGLADREKRIVNTIDTRFRIGSMNKMFTAVATLQLVQAAKIALDAPLGRYVTDYPNRDVATKVTIHHLLTHTGGTGDIFGPEYGARRLATQTLNDHVALYGSRGPAFEPGARFAYSNYGMLLLGVVIERVSGESYYDYVAEHIYKPAGMSRTGSEPESSAPSSLSIGYTRPRNSTLDWSTTTGSLPYRGTSAGGGYSTVNDLFRFATALMGKKLLDAEHTTLLLTGKVNTGPGPGGPMLKLSYAYGFEDQVLLGVHVVGHGGGAPGMSGDLRIYPQSGHVLVVLSNLDPPAGTRYFGFVTDRMRLPDVPRVQDPVPQSAIPAILGAFANHQIVGLAPGHHGNKDVDDFVLTLVRDPRFPRTVNDIVVEGVSSLRQSVLDRYVAGEDVPLPELQHFWRSAMSAAGTGSNFYPQLIAIIRRVNRTLPAASRVRVLGGEPPIDWFAVSSREEVKDFLGSGIREQSLANILDREVFAKGRKALVLYGGMHLYHTDWDWAMGLYEQSHPRAFVIDTHFFPCAASVGAFPGRLAPPSFHDLETRMTTWPVPSVARIGNTWLTQLNESRSGIFGRPKADGSLVTIPWSKAVDALLYLGPAKLMVQHTTPAYAVQDSTLLNELQRRRSLGAFSARAQDQFIPDGLRRQEQSPLICAEGGW